MIAVSLASSMLLSFVPTKYPNSVYFMDQERYNGHDISSGIYVLHATVHAWAAFTKRAYIRCIEMSGDMSDYIA